MPTTSPDHESDSCLRLFLIGPSGSGKRAVGERLGRMIGYPFLDTDAEVVRKSGARDVTEVFDTRGEPFFRDLEKKLVDEIIDSNRPIVVATGGGMPAIPHVMSLLNHHGLTIYLKAAVGTLWSRLTSDPREIASRPLLKNQGEERLRQLVAEREPVYMEAAVTLRTDSLSVDEVCAALIGIVRRRMRHSS